MKKIIIVSLVLGLMLLGGCSKNQELQKKNDNNELSKTELFDKKKECALLSNDMLKYAKEFRSEVFEINEIFYSPKLNSCLFIADAGDEELLFDFFNRTNLDISNCLPGDECIQKSKKLQELKGE